MTYIFALLILFISIGTMASIIRIGVEENTVAKAITYASLVAVGAIGAVLFILKSGVM